MPSLLVSTFRRLLKVELSPKGEMRDIEMVSGAHGVYFGLERWGPVVFVAERNLDINKEPITPGDPQNAIRIYIRLPSGRMIRTPVYYKSKAFDDLHQIAYDRGALFVTSGKFPFLIRKGLFGGRRGIDITGPVPEPYRRHDDHNHDAYHINSVAVQGDHLIALAHNWDMPSFALRLSLKDARRGKMTCTRVYEDLGFCCHDIIPDGDVFWTLDSGGSALVRVHVETGAMDRFVMTDAQGAPFDSAHGVPFPRGIDIMGDLLVISYGFNEDRADRMDSNAMLAVFDTKQEAFVRHLSLGSHGNTCAVMAL
ncbi:hypothetical protein Z946_209 [Sulfitobacter noctilucicola]|uniref:Uncharacterized protein n=1 Tax=Sulfitobacter noctilucicola TaxID=1342301 RepID=A0A7W6Q7U7_9RHOB|nr:hypothetical protein [Sulfitobacter noctilucicola]KIN69843.1 hypothetical protein Z946_209 [Sulfitobacter noctilucicola]MBB4176212.1 hypothetical protein [Sulfitobacter noctilucicola]